MESLDTEFSPDFDGLHKKPGSIVPLTHDSRSNVYKVWIEHVFTPEIKVSCV
jgi:hypothetical protein